MSEYADIYEYAAQALVRFEEPDFTHFDMDSVDIAMRNVIVHEQDENEFLGIVSSHGALLIPARFTTGIKGLNRTYTLSKEGRKEKVVIAMGDKPIKFWGQED